MSLPEFLLARIAEDEADARSAVLASGVWEAMEVNDEPEQSVMTGAQVIDRLDADTEGRGYGVVNTRRFGGLIGNDGTVMPAGPTGIDQLRHIARHDPFRVLAECEAKRRIVEECREESYPAPGIGYIDGERVTGRYISSIGLPHILRLLALPYADHPNYSEEWKP